MAEAPQPPSKNRRAGERRTGPRTAPGGAVWYVLGFLLLLAVAQAFFFQIQSGDTIPYSEFKRLVRENKVQEVTLSEERIRGVLKPQGSERAKPFTAIRVTDAKLPEELEAHGVKYTGELISRWVSDVLGWVIPLVFIVALWMFFLRRMGGAEGGVMSFARSKAKLYAAEDDVKVSFTDVAGVDEAEEELKEIVEFLKTPKKYTSIGGKIPKGVLLVGPPGTGKTLLARAVAGEAKVPFFSLSGSEFVEMFVGVGAARVRDLFEQARQKAPAIIFIDELDALGRARGAFGGIGGHDEKEQTLNQLLVEMDGFDPSSGLVLLAATNRPEILDPALLRAGRFDRQVLVDRPDRTGRVQILKVHLRKVKFAADVNVEEIAALTPGFSGADLANLINEAALLATRRNAEFVTMHDFNVAIERIVAGLEKKNRLLNPHERRVVAYHEMGHALVATTLPGSDPVHKISIIPRGVGALGYTIQRPTEDRFLMTREELENKMAVLLGGRAAEQVVFGHFSTGAADDLQKVTDIARSMIMRYGMDPSLGHVAYESERRSFLGDNLPMGSERSYSEETAREIDRAVRGIVEHTFKRSVGILTERRATLERGATLLLEKETLVEQDLKALMA